MISIKVDSSEEKKTFIETHFNDGEELAEDLIHVFVAIYKVLQSTGLSREKVNKDFKNMCAGIIELAENGELDD